MNTTKRIQGIQLVLAFGVDIGNLAAYEYEIMGTIGADGSDGNSEGERFFADANEGYPEGFV